MKAPLGIDFVQSEIQNAKIQNLGSDPSSPVVGQLWFNTATQKLMYKDSTGNRDVTYLAQVVALRLDQFAAPTSDITLNNRKIINLADGVSAQDAVTYSQLMSVLQGRTFKDAVRVATNVNQATLSGLLTLDGITTVAGDRILLFGQTTASQNGPWVAASGAWTRPTDWDATSDISFGASFLVREGATNADKQFTLTTDGAIVVGTTAVAFAQTGAGTTYVQGTGISISGSTIAIDTTVVVRKYAANIGDGTATSFTLTHNFGTLDVQVTVRLISTGEQVLVDNVAATTNTVTIGVFATAPTSNQYRVIVQA